VTTPVNLEALSFHSWPIEQPVGGKRQSTLREVIAETHPVKQFQRESFEVDLTKTAVILETLLWIAVNSKFCPHVLVESASQCLHDPLAWQRKEH
jgi:hypothetical protein